jgi:hypothetical protein
MQPEVPSSDQAGFMLQQLLRLTIRPATITDVVLIARPISEPAVLDNAPHRVITTEGDISRDGIGADQHFLKQIARWLSERAVFRGYSSTRRGAGCSLEDPFCLRRISRAPL